MEQAGASAVPLLIGIGWIPPAGYMKRRDGEASVGRHCLVKQMQLPTKLHDLLVGVPGELLPEILLRREGILPKEPGIKDDSSKDAVPLAIGSEEFVLG